MTRAAKYSDSEAGLTLIELVITVSIMSIAFVAIVSALGTTVIVSDVHKRQTTAESVLGSWAETLKARQYEADPGTFYNTTDSQVLVDVPSGYTANVTVLCDGDPTTSGFDNPTSPPCTTGLEQLTLTVTSARGVTKTTSILKRVS